MEEERRRSPAASPARGGGASSWSRPATADEQSHRAERSRPGCAWTGVRNGTEGRGCHSMAGSGVNRAEGAVLPVPGPRWSPPGGRSSLVPPLPLRSPCRTAGDAPPAVLPCASGLVPGWVSRVPGRLGARSWRQCIWAVRHTAFGLCSSGRSGGSRHHEPTTSAAAWFLASCAHSCCLQAASAELQPILASRTRAVCDPAARTLRHSMCSGTVYCHHRPWLAGGKPDESGVGG